MRDNNDGHVSRRTFLAGTLACGSAAFLSASSSLNAAVSEMPGGEIFRICTDNSGCVYAAAVRGDGSSAIEVYRMSGSSKNGALGYDEKAGIASTGSGPLRFNYPQGLTLDAKGMLFVSDSNNGRVQVLSIQGVNGTYPGKFTYVKSIGGLGPGPGQLHSPGGLSVYDDFLYIADTRNHRVQLFSLESSTVDCVIGEKGDAPGQFKLPSDVAVDEEGSIFVADSGNGRVQVFPAFNPLTFDPWTLDASRRIEPLILGEGDFNFPINSLIVSRGLLIVCESAVQSGAGFHLHVFERRGTLWQRSPARDDNLNKRAGSAGLKDPFGLAFADGRIPLISDRFSGRVYVL